jgi:peptidoglycan/LPS O-acetylase OafA/YrhL
MRPRKILVAAALAALALAAPATAVAAQTYTDTLTGYEYAFTSTDGRFAGTAAGALPGGWEADIRHTQLCLSCSPTATITGGSFSLATAYSLIVGHFTRGTVQVLNPGAGCTKQTFAVDGRLGGVGRWTAGTGSGTFAVTLTHYRRSILGHCTTYGAKVVGTLSLTL